MLENFLVAFHWILRRLKIRIYNRLNFLSFSTISSDIWTWQSKFYWLFWKLNVFSGTTYSLTSMKSLTVWNFKFCPLEFWDEFSNSISTLHNKCYESEKSYRVFTIFCCRHLMYTYAIINSLIRWIHELWNNSHVTLDQWYPHYPTKYFWNNFLLPTTATLAYRVSSIRFHVKVLFIGC